MSINKYLRNEKNLVNPLDEKYGSSTSLLNKTMEKIDSIMKSSSGNIYCYLLLSIIAIFTILYFLI